MHLFPVSLTHQAGMSCLMSNWKGRLRCSNSGNPASWPRGRWGAVVSNQFRQQNTRRVTSRWEPLPAAAWWERKKASRPAEDQCQITQNGVQCGCNAVISWTHHMGRLRRGEGEERSHSNEVDLHWQNRLFYSFKMWTPPGKASSMPVWGQSTLKNNNNQPSNQATM